MGTGSNVRQPAPAGGPAGAMSIHHLRRGLMQLSSPASSRRPVGYRVASALVFLIALRGTAFLHPQELANWDFEMGGLEDFFVNETALFCDAGEIPNGDAIVEDGEVLMTNDLQNGFSFFTLAPGTMEDLFGDGPRDFRLRVKVRLDTVSIFSMYVRMRLGVDVENSQVDVSLLRTYKVDLRAPGIDPAFPEGFLALSERTTCQRLVPHPEWPGAAGRGFAAQALGFRVTQEDFIQMEVTVTGSDDGGPVHLAARAFLDGDDPDSCPTIAVVDLDGLPHTPEALAPEAEIGAAFGSSNDENFNEPGMTCRVDDIRIDRFSGCDIPPLTATRSLWSPRVSVEGTQASQYEPSGERSVSVQLSDPRPAGACQAATSVTVCERVPPGWTVTRASAGGSIGDGSVSWTVDLSAGLPAPLGYDVMADDGAGLVTFTGSLREGVGPQSFAVGGDQNAVGAASLPPISDFGSIQHWLVLGPFIPEVPGANPGEAEIRRDYLTDGVTNQENVRPRAGDVQVPDFGGPAASTGLAADFFGRNPDGEPRWVEWRDLDDAVDRVDFESVYGPVDNVLCHALTYLEVEEATEIHLGVSSDDSIQILLDGEERHIHDVGRPASSRTYQDTPDLFPGLGNIVLGRGRYVLLVKVFEGIGEHNFRVGFLDESGIEIPGGPEGVKVTLEPGPRFRRGDSNASGGLNITDGVFVLNYLFLGGQEPLCLDAADSDDNGNLNISDGVRILNFLFLGGAAPPAPGAQSCGEDPVEDELNACVYEAC